jgi:queuine tRNA-ribosyltransferase
MDFQVLHTDPASKARTGLITTPHGPIHTPVFMPVGTQASVKAVHIPELKADTRASIILSNTYHLYLRPGTSTFEQVGGIHRFTGWDRPILTDSGGFQVFSLAHNRKLTQQGATFRSHIDGSTHLFSPEKVIDIQRSIGADIIMAFDECCPGDADRPYAERSLALTDHWLHRCFARFRDTQDRYGYPQALFPIVQGCVFPDLRRRAAETVAAYGAEGNAIGGLSVGEPTHLMYEMIEIVNEVLPPDRPRYLMGVGTPANLLEGIARGIDMFDCIIPTRNGRNGQLFTRLGTINIRNCKWRDDFSPVDPDDLSFVDTHYSRAYLHHLFRTNEFLALQIASLHNLAFYRQLMDDARSHISQGDFSSWMRTSLESLTNRL